MALATGEALEDLLAADQVPTLNSAMSLRRLRLKCIQRRAILSFYLRPRTLAFLARRMKPRLLPGVVKALWRYAR